MKLEPRLRFTAADGSPASIPMHPFRTIEAGEKAIDMAIKAARAEGGRNMTLELVTPDGAINLYRWIDD